MRKERKADNKGFSLVELIIVIAIMAILIGVLAPQYLKFVERSRKSTDRQNVDEIVRAVEIYATDPDPEASGTITSGATVTITTSSTAVSTTNATGGTDAALTAAGIDKLVLKSKQWKDASGATVSQVVLTFTIDSDGNVSVSAGGVTDGTNGILD